MREIWITYVYWKSDYPHHALENETFLAFIYIGKARKNRDHGFHGVIQGF